MRGLLIREVQGRVVGISHGPDGLVPSLRGVVGAAVENPSDNRTTPAILEGLDLAVDREVQPPLGRRAEVRLTDRTLNTESLDGLADRQVGYAGVDEAALRA